MGEGAGSKFIRTAIGCGAALLITVLVFVAIGVGGFFAMESPTHDNGQALGRVAGLLFIPVALMSLGIGFAWVKKPALGAVLTVGILFIPVATTALTYLVSHRERSVFRDPTPAERAAPVLTPSPMGPRMVQAALGLDLPQPLDLTLVPDDPVLAQSMASMQEQGLRMIGWRWSSPDEDRQIILMVILESARSEDDQASFLDGTVDGAAESFRGLGIEPTVDRRGPLDRVLRGRHPTSGLSMVMRIVGYTHGEAFVIATLTASAADISPLEPVVNGLRETP